MNESVTSFIKAAVRNTVGPIQRIKARQTRLELFDSSNGSSRSICVVEAEPQSEGIKATISGVEPISVTGGHFEEVTQSVFDRLPGALFASARVDVRLSGVDQAGVAMNAIGSSVHGNIFVVNQTEAALEAEGCVRAEATVPGIIAAGVNAAVDHIVSRKGDAARIYIARENAGINGFTWATLTARDGSIFVMTNDFDEFTAPSFRFASQEGAEIKALSIEALTKLFVDAPQVTVRVFREESRVGFLAVLEGTSAEGSLREQPEFPSL